MKHNARYYIGDRGIMPADNLMGVQVLLGNRKGLTLAECFAPEAFGWDDLALQQDSIVHVHGTDGCCWATVAGKTPLGNAILKPDVQFVAPPAVEAEEQPAAQPVRRSKAA